MKYTKSILVLFLVVVSAQLYSQHLKVESYSVSFSIKNAGLTVEGSFQGLTYNLYWDDQGPQNSILEATLKVETIETGIDLRNQHLTGKSYFNGQQYPEINMKSTAIRVINAKEGKFVGDFVLTIKGKERTLEIPFSYIKNSLKSTFEINRLDFGVGGSSFTMSDTVKIEILINAS